MKDIILTIKSIAKEKIIYYGMLSSFIVLFLMYHNNFFRPYNFWLMYSYIMMFLIPVYFYMFMEKKHAIKWIGLICFTILIIGSPLIMFFKQIKIFFSGESVSVITAAIASLPLISAALFSKDAIVSDIGLNFKNFRLSGLIILIAALIMIPIVIIASRTGDFSKVYPLFRVMEKGGMTFVLYELYFLFFFIIWEFFFRGFMLFSFNKHLKNINLAILLQAVIFAFSHYGKPELETISSFFGALLLGAIIYRTKNIFPAAIIHFITALTMDIIAVFIN